MLLIEMDVSAPSAGLLYVCPGHTAPAAAYRGRRHGNLPQCDALQQRSQPVNLYICTGDILRPCILLQVGLAGPSGSGKTAFSEKVRSFIPGCTVLSMDNYNDASRLIDGNFDGESVG